MGSWDSFKSWWNGQSKIRKGLIIVIIIFLLLGIVGNFGGDDKAVTNEDVTCDLNETPKVVTIGELYGHSVAEGTLVKVTGTVLQSDESSLRIENSDGKDIYITGSNLHAYEDHKVTVVGRYNGPESYTTVNGASRTVPSIKGAKLV